MDGGCMCMAGGGAKKAKKTVMYNGRPHVVHKGTRGGSYILVKGKKVYV